MIEIYLCDDEPAVRQQIQMTLERKILIEGWDMKVVCSVDSPRSFWETWKKIDTRQGIDFLGSLNELEGQLGERFLRIHRAYLVAVDKIEEIDLKHGKLRVGGRECLVSRSGKALLCKKI